MGEEPSSSHPVLCTSLRPFPMPALGSPLHSKLTTSWKPTPARGVPYHTSPTASLPRPCSSVLTRCQGLWYSKRGECQHHWHYLVRNAGPRAPPQTCRTCILIGSQGDPCAHESFEKHQATSSCVPRALKVSGHS